jgi:hypothetical protein
VAPVSPILSQFFRLVGTQEALTNVSASECFYRCDKCRKVPNPSNGINLIAARVLIGKDPDHNRWGVIFEACKNPRNASNNADATFLNYVLLPVGK